MARYDVSLINGITKVETATGHVYHFPLELIETFTAENAMRRTQRGQSDYEYVKFSNITDKLGTGAIDGYVNQLAIRGYYLSLDTTQTANLGTGVLDTNANIENTTLLKSIDSSLKEIVFLLKGIAE